jgi:hypothetical protein
MRRALCPVDQRGFRVRSLSIDASIFAPWVHGNGASRACASSAVHGWLGSQAGLSCLPHRGKVVEQGCEHARGRSRCVATDFAAAAHGRSPSEQARAVKKHCANTKPSGLTGWRVTHLRNHHAGGRARRFRNEPRGRRECPAGKTCTAWKDAETVIHVCLPAN